MTKPQLDSIAKSLGKLAGQNGIDESTRRLCVDAVESAIQHTSNMLDKTVPLLQFRELSKTLEPKR